MMMQNALAQRIQILGALTLLTTTGSLLSASAQDKANEKKIDPLPTFKSTWKIDLPADTKRVAIADIIGDGKPRLLTLAADDTLTIHKLVEGKTEKETSIGLGKDAGKFVVGHFAKGKPALIVAPGGTFYWDKDKLSKKPAPEREGLYGSLRLKDGSETFFVFSQNAPPATYTIDLSTENIYLQGPDLPQPMAENSPIRELVLDFPREFFEMESFPDEIKKGAIARVFDPRGADKLFGLFAWQANDGPYVVVLEGASLFPQPQNDAKPIWKSPKLVGKALDIAFGKDMKDIKTTGFYVLQESGAEKKERTLEFFALNPLTP